MKTRLNDDFLDSMRALGDPIADNVIQQLVESGEIPSVGHLMRQMAKNDGAIDPGLPPRVIEYFATTRDLPPWADAARISVAQRFFEKHGFSILVVLACYSLPSSFAAWRGAKVMHRTGRLQQDCQRRLADTAQMVVEVMGASGLAQGGRGILRLQKVRLLHAAIRHFILAGQEPWSPDLGAPINQEDLAGTLMTFSTLVLDGLKELGILATGEEADAYIHTWNVVGHFMGIRPDLLQTSREDACALSEAIKLRNFAPSEEGRALVKALLAMMIENTPIASCKGLAPSMMRHFLGNEVSAILDLPESDWTGSVFRKAILLNRALEVLGGRSERVSALVDWIGLTHEHGIRLLRHENVRPREGAHPLPTPRLRRSAGPGMALND